MKVYTVVVTYNGMEWISDCLASLVNSKMKTGIIVVDNKSTDGTAGWIRENYPEVVLIDMEENEGFARANNRGIRNALKMGADAVFLLNQDATVETETIGILCKACNSSFGYGIFSPLHMKSDKSALEIGFAGYLIEEWERRGLDPGEQARRIDPAVLKNYNDILFPVRFVNAAAWMISRECLRLTGGFCPLFFMYGEDLDYSRRAAAAGFKTAVVPTAQICHFRDHKDKGKEKWNKEWELNHFERSLFLLFLNPFLNTLQRIIAFVSIWIRGSQHIISEEPYSIFHYYSEKNRLFLHALNRYKSLQKKQSWRFLLNEDERDFH